ncbi:WD40 repeat domain-containing protein [Baaleninema sp.]|uniref:WD40 repeat domain-containing protein n=1 Tax=Baaleninema sp. TaxID=3101197 RepID=UPI003D07C632
MDWTTPLKALQADFQRRLTCAVETGDSSLLLHCPRSGFHSEYVEISGDRLSQLRASCRRLILRSDPSIPVRELLRQYLREQLGRAALSAVLDSAVTPIPFDPAAESPEAAFTLAERPKIRIAVETVIGDRLPELSRSPNAPDSEVVVWVWIREPIDETCQVYRPILAGFLPSDRLKTASKLPSQALLYIGGLSTCLEDLSTSVTPLSQDWLRPVTGASNSTYPLAVGADGATLVSGGYDGSLKLWFVGETTVSRALAGRTWSVAPATTGNSGQALSISSTDKALHLVQSGSAQLKRSFAGHESGVSAVALSPDGAYLVSGGYEGTIKIWHAESGDLCREIPAHQGVVRPLALSANGQVFASSSTDKKIKVWNLATGDAVRTVEAASESIAALALSPDGNLLASGFQDGKIEIWHVASGERVHYLDGHAGTVRSMVLSNDGQLLASGSIERTVKLWDLQTGKLQQVLTGYPDPLIAIAPNANGRRVDLSLFQPVRENPSDSLRPSVVKE